MRSSRELSTRKVTLSAGFSAILTGVPPCPCAFAPATVAPVCALVCVCVCVRARVCARCGNEREHTRVHIYLYIHISYHITYVCVGQYRPAPHWARCLVQRGVAPAACLWPHTDSASLARGFCVRASKGALRRMSPLCMYDSHTFMTPIPCVRASVCCLGCRRCGSES